MLLNLHSLKSLQIRKKLVLLFFEVDNHYIFALLKLMS